MRIRDIVPIIISAILLTTAVISAEDQSTGNLCVTVRNVGGNSVSGARVVRYPDGSYVYTPNCFNGIPVGAYDCEAYYTGTFWGEEYWGDGSATVSSGSTTYLTINRIYPHIESVTFRNHATGVIINPTDQIALGLRCVRKSLFGTRSLSLLT